MWQQRAGLRLMEAQQDLLVVGQALPVLVDLAQRVDAASAAETSQNGSGDRPPQFWTPACSMMPRGLGTFCLLVLSGLGAA